MNLLLINEKFLRDHKYLTRFENLIRGDFFKVKIEGTVGSKLFKIATNPISYLPILYKSKMQLSGMNIKKSLVPSTVVAGSRTCLRFKATSKGETKDKKFKKIKYEIIGMRVSNLTAPVTHAFIRK